MREEYTAFCQLLLRPIISAVLADTDISVKPKYRSISSKEKSKTAYMLEAITSADSPQILKLFTK